MKIEPFGVELWMNDNPAVLREGLPKVSEFLSALA